jgi:hypothetical protein
MFKELSLTQKILALTLIALLLLMVFFSIQALQNQGRDGFEHCIEKKCNERGEEFCTKSREVNNCCQGAGGQLGNIGGQLDCVFN